MWQMHSQRCGAQIFVIRLIRKEYVAKYNELLQFEWAWQHPTESLAVRKTAATFKSLSGLANKIKLAYTMLNLPSWQRYDTVFSQECDYTSFHF